MAAPSLLPCGPWAPLPAEPCAPAPDDAVMLAATTVLWRLSGRRYGTCDVVARPCASRCAPGPGFPRLAIDSGLRGWWPTCGCGGRACDCSTRDRLRLPGPIVTVNAVWYDGVQLDDGLYHVERWKWLVRDDGETWPTCQDYGAPDHGEGAFAVEYTRGRPVPPDGQMAVGQLACEMQKAINGDRCDLPKRVRELTRQGVSMALLDPMDFLDKGRTGLYFVDLFLSAANPNRLQRTGRVHSARQLGYET